MTATFTCNVCKDAVPAEDAHALSRESDGVKVTIYPESKSQTGTHICAGCAAGILISGTRPVHDPSADF